MKRATTMLCDLRGYKLISFDMFQTLVDVNKLRDCIMKKVFQGIYTKGMGITLWEDANKYIYSYFHKMNENGVEFVKTIDVFEACYEELFPKYGISLKPIDGAKILALAHNEAPLFPDVLPVYKQIIEKYDTCLISDTDVDMVDGLINKFNFNRIYLSEEYHTYKSSKTGLLFKKAINDFNIKPEEMIHLGDGANDVLGAKMVGAKAIWINRDNKEWKNEIEPDYIISNMSEIVI
jgi:putative hydrolase of the HAD superfamily